MSRGWQERLRPGRGLALVAASVSLIAAAPAQGVKPGDFDGDGRADLAIGVPSEDLDFNMANQPDAGAVNVLTGALGGIDPATAGDTLLTQDDAGGAPDDVENFGDALAAGDFDGDGHADLAVGVPEQTVSGQNSAGEVNVFYGSDAGINGGDAAQILHQGTASVAEDPEPFDWFGIEVVSGDWNGDGFDDLAVCAVQDDVATNLTDGTVSVLYGSMSGLSGTGSQLLTQDTPGLRGAVQGGERFGGSMAAGDFDGDGVDDLAAGSSNEDADAGAINHAGAVNVIYGSDGGLTVEGDELLQQGANRLKGKPGQDEDFGAGLASGDAQNDGRDDLAVGIPGQSGGFSGKGAVHFLAGSANGLLRPHDRVFNQNTKGIPSRARPDEAFGRVLAFGDFTADGRADLAIGVSPEKLKGVAGDDHGAVNVVFGTAGGLSTAGAQLWSQGTPGVAGVPLDNDFLGLALGAGNFDGKPGADLAIGSSDDPGGAVNVLYSRSGGLSAKGDDLFTQDSAGISGTAETNDGFGRTIAPG